MKTFTGCLQGGSSFRLPSRSTYTGLPPICIYTTGHYPILFLIHFSISSAKLKSNIATLNYDRLLYAALIDAGFMNGGYRGYLVDGMIDGGGDA